MSARANRRRKAKATKRLAMWRALPWHRKHSPLIALRHMYRIIRGMK